MDGTDSDDSETAGGQRLSPAKVQSLPQTAANTGKLPRLDGNNGKVSFRLTGFYLHRYLVRCTGKFQLLLLVNYWSNRERLVRNISFKIDAKIEDLFIILHYFDIGRIPFSDPRYRYLYFYW